MQKGKIELTQKDAENTPAGGVVVGKRDGQTMIYDDASLGGYFVGKLHSEGGIKMINKSTGQPLEVQGSEVIITAPAVYDKTKRNFEGKMMTNREILSKINSDGGGVSFADGGDIPAKIHTTDCEYKFGGKVVKDTDIAHSLGMNSTLKKGKQQFSSGDTTYDVDAIYNAIKKGKLRLKTKEVETFPMKYPVYDKNYAENHKIDFRKPNGITVRTESGEEVLIDGNHRMNNAYSKGRKTMKTYYVEDPKQISKFTNKTRVLSDDYQNKMASSTAKKEIRNHYNKRGDAFDDRKDSENWTKYSLPYDTRFDIEFKKGGHLSSGKSLKQIAEMHNVSLAHINEQLAKGLEVEKEHFADFKERTRIAKDHLVENPNYYTILEKAGLKDGGHLKPHHKKHEEDLVKDAKDGNTPARDLNNYNDLMDVQADGEVGGDSGIEMDGALVTGDSGAVNAFANGGEVGNEPKEGDLITNFGKYGVFIFDVDDKYVYWLDQYASKQHCKKSELSLNNLDDDGDDDGYYEGERNNWICNKVYADGGIAPYDANQEGDSVSVLSTGGGVGLPKVAYVKVSNTGSSLSNLIGDKYNSYIEFAESVEKVYKQLGRTVRSYVVLTGYDENDKKLIEVNTSVSNQKNTVRNFNPFTGNYKNLEKSLANSRPRSFQNYDWEDWLLSKVRPLSVSSMQNEKTVENIVVQYKSKETSENGLVTFYNPFDLMVFLRELTNGDYEDISLQPIGRNNLSQTPKSFDIASQTWKDILKQDEDKAEAEMMSVLQFGEFPDLDFTEFIKSGKTTSKNQSVQSRVNLVKDFDFTDTKIDVEDNPELSQKVQKRAFELGWEWENNGGKTIDYNDFNYLYFTKTSISSGNTTSSFIKSPKRKITEEEIFGSQKNNLASKKDNSVDLVRLDYELDGKSYSKSFRKAESLLKDFTKIEDYCKTKPDDILLVNITAEVVESNGKIISKKKRISFGENAFKPRILPNNYFKELITEEWFDNQLDFNEFFKDVALSSKKDVQSVLVTFAGGQTYTALNEEKLLDKIIELWKNGGRSTMSIILQPQGSVISPSQPLTILLDTIRTSKTSVQPSSFSLSELRGYLSEDWYPELDWSDFFEETQTPTSNTVVPKTTEKAISDLDEAVKVLEKASSKVATEYNMDAYDKSLKFLYDTKSTYELALKFTPESAFMYERLDILKKLADLEKSIKKIEDMKKGGAFYMLAQILEKLQRGENWRTSENAQDVITNQLPQSEIDVIIRSQKFKNWFGDWEKALVNDEYDNVSKALTDGVPSVYHHGARRIKYTYREVSNGVLYLAENISYAIWFSQNSTAQSEEGNYLTDCFVNIKNPIDLTAFHVNQIDLGDLVRYIYAIYPLARIYDFIPAQVALLIKTNQPTNVRMRAWQLIRSYAKFVNHIKENTPYDGFLYYENNPSDQVINPVTGQSEENVTKAVAIFKSHQVKVVDAVLFDGGLDDWRFENGGKINN